MKIGFYLALTIYFGWLAMKRDDTRGFRLFCGCVAAFMAVGVIAEIVA